MIDALREALGFSKGKSRVDFDHDRMLALAIIKELEIVGEAATKVSAEGRAACSQIPWADIVGMGNRLIHGYFDIDLDLVWNTVVDDLSPLLAQLESVKNA
jgi:uncharacterized protein with HEPN domain